MKTHKNQTTKKAGRRKKSKLVIGSLLALIVAGFFVVMYPVFSNMLHEIRQKQLINEYTTAIKETDTSAYDKMFEQAREYNRNLVLFDIPDAFAIAEDTAPNALYESLLNPDGNGMMGYIEIPSIALQLPIYHSVREEALQNGVGHLEGSSLPVGDSGSHVVLAGHRGLPSAKLFTDLDLVTMGDVFYLFILNRQMAYEIDHILIVEPSDTAFLEVVDNEDRVTLVTCTPYGVNTQRMLISGHRIPMDKKAYEEAPKGEKITVTNRYILYPAIAILLVLVTTIFLLIIGSRRRKRKRR